MEHGPAVPDEDFQAIADLYNEQLPGNNAIHDLIYPLVYGTAEYIGQFSDNSASELRRMGQLMDLPPRSSVLEIGCGTAAVTCHLARTFGWRAVGIDISATPLEKARRRLATMECGGLVRVIHGNVYEHRFRRTFDGVYGTGAFCHFNARRLFSRCRSLLRRKGVLAFMERVRIRELTSVEWGQLTVEWACPGVYTIAEYTELLEAAGFRVRTVENLTPTFRIWQARSVEARERSRDQIIALTSRDYYESSLRLAAHEDAATRAGKLGYALFVACLD